MGKFRVLFAVLLIVCTASFGVLCDWEGNWWFGLLLVTQIQFSFCKTSQFSCNISVVSPT